MPLTSDSSTGNLIVVVIISIVISGASLVYLYGFPYSPDLSLYYMASFALTGVWLLLLLYAVAKFGKRSLWLLIGAPPVLWVMLQFFLLVTCGFWRGGCP